MKRVLCLILCVFTVAFCFVGCGEKDPATETVTNEQGEVVEPTQYMTNENGYIVQPSNALQQVVDGMLLCYLDYIVEDSEFYAIAESAVTPAIITDASEFQAFFEYSDENGNVQKKAQKLYDEMNLTDEGKAIYADADFYDKWHLIVVSVRENNADTKHTINSVEYNTDSCIFTVNATRDVAEGDGENTAYHYVFRVPKNVYNGVRHSFKKNG